MNSIDGSTFAIDAKSLAQMLGVSVRHVRRMDAAAQIPAAVRMGRAKRWLVSEIEDWLAARCPDRHVWSLQRRIG